MKKQSVFVLHELIGGCVCGKSKCKDCRAGTYPSVLIHGVFTTEKKLLIFNKNI